MKLNEAEIDKIKEDCLKFFGPIFNEDVFILKIKENEIHAQHQFDGFNDLISVQNYKSEIEKITAYSRDCFRTLDDIKETRLEQETLRSKLMVGEEKKKSFNMLTIEDFKDFIDCKYMSLAHEKDIVYLNSLVYSKNSTNSERIVNQRFELSNDKGSLTDLCELIIMLKSKELFKVDGKKATFEQLKSFFEDILNIEIKNPYDLLRDRYKSLETSFFDSNLKIKMLNEFEEIRKKEVEKRR